MNKMLSLVLAAVLALSMIPAALAETAAQEPQPAETSATDSAAYQAALDKYNAARKTNELSDLKTELDAMVAAGQLTQEEADTVYSRALVGEAMDKYRNAKRENNSGTTALKTELDAMVAAGQLTQEEADAIEQGASQNATSPNGCAPSGMNGPQGRGAQNDGRGMGGRDGNDFGGKGGNNGMSGMNGNGMNGNGMNGANNGGDTISSSTPSSSQQP